MLDNFAAGGAAINQICAAYGLGFKVFDLALDMPTGDITEASALDERARSPPWRSAWRRWRPGTDCLGIGEMGIGNTTVAAALYAALFGGEPAHWVGHGTGRRSGGLEPEGRGRGGGAGPPCRPSRRPSSGTGPPRRPGDRRHGGAILAARLQRIPVVIDGYVATAAAAVLHAADPSALDHCLAGHVSAEGVHAEVLERLGLVPLLALGMRLGEASGAGMAMGLLKGALACHTGMATFAQAVCPGSRRRPPVDPPRRHHPIAKVLDSKGRVLWRVQAEPCKQVSAPKGAGDLLPGFHPDTPPKGLVPLESPIRRSSRCSRRTARAP